MNKETGEQMRVIGLVDRLSNTREGTETTSPPERQLGKQGGIRRRTSWNSRQLSLQALEGLVMLSAVRVVT